MLSLTLEIFSVISTYFLFFECNIICFSALNTCSVDLLLKVGTLLPELAVHEKSVDHFIELLRKDQLDENTSTDPLEKSISYFQVTNMLFSWIYHIVQRNFIGN